MVKPVASIFLHFFDMHFLEMKAESDLSDRIVSEATLATRFAFLSASALFIPAASFFESALCRGILSFYEPVFGEGRFWLLGNEVSLVEFRESKLFQYQKNSTQYLAYSKDVSSVVPPYQHKSAGATQFIKENWARLRQTSGQMARIYQANPSITVAKFEKNWDLVSDRLGQLAFIVDHVVPKLFGSETVSLSAKNRLHHIINDAYFRSFTEDLRASVVTDLVYLQYEVTGNGEVDVPFSALVQSCRHHGILEEISICDLAHLIKLESDPRWALAFGDAVRAYSRKSSLRGKTTLKIETLRSFIVHGRDEELLFKLKDYLQNTLKMQEPVVLKQQPNAGRTIIEKFEECSEEVDVALVLLTPDDFGGLEGGVGESRARQNVIYELGYFIGKLGRRSGRVLLLYKGDLQIPSDLLGVCYIAVDKGISAAGEEIRKELTSIK